MQYIKHVIHVLASIIGGALDERSEDVQLIYRRTVKCTEYCFKTLTDKISLIILLYN